MVWNLEAYCHFKSQSNFSIMNSLLLLFFNFEAIKVHLYILIILSYTNIDDVYIGNTKYYTIEWKKIVWVYIYASLKMMREDHHISILM